MLRKRLIPSLLLFEGGLVRTRGFKNPSYIGDPVNAVKIFSEKQADELIILDKTPDARGPNFQLIEDMAGEAFMPLSYGGNVKSVDDARNLFRLGIEKIIVNDAAFSNPELLSAISDLSGSSSLVLAVNVKKFFFGGYHLYSSNGAQKIPTSLETHIIDMQKLGIGEILICDINSEGSQKGLDLDLIAYFSSIVNVPLLISGGMRNVQDARDAFDIGVDGVVGGDMFVYYGEHRAVLINYPSENEVSSL